MMKKALTKQEINLINKALQIITKVEISIENRLGDWDDSMHPNFHVSASRVYLQDAKDFIGTMIKSNLEE